MTNRPDPDGRFGVGPTVRLETARTAVARLFANTPTPIHATSFRVDLLCEAFVAPDPRRHQLAIEGLLQSDLSEEDILTRLIPETARRLGDRWLDDRLSFAEVTIGATRLQQMLHARSRNRTYPQPDSAPRILMAVPLQEQHTLGAHVAAHVWRNHSVHVEMALGETPSNIALQARDSDFSAICISVSARRNLAWAGVVVESIKTVTQGNTKVFIGGGVTALDADIKALTGCDVVSSDPAVVLRTCGTGLVPSQP